MFALLYDYRSEDNIQDIITGCLYPIIEDIEDEFCTLRRYDSLYIYAPVSIAKQIISHLLENLDDLFINEESNNHLLLEDDNDVLITLGYDGMMFIESARFETGEIKPADGVLNYAYDGFSITDVRELASNECPIFVFGLEENIGNKVKMAIKEHE